MRVEDTCVQELNYFMHIHECIKRMNCCTKRKKNDVENFIAFDAIKSINQMKCWKFDSCEFAYIELKRAETQRTEEKGEICLH